MALWLAAFATISPAGAQSGQSALLSDRPDAMLVMDFSGSMWGQVNGRAKFQIANDVIQQRFDGWNESLNLGVMAYGHRRQGDCRDIEMAFRPGQTASSAVRRWLGQQNPVGKTPLGGSLIEASNYFNSNGQEANLIILSDGIESCGQDPCRIIQDLQAQGAQMTAHVIGFDLNEDDSNALRCIADLTGGLFVGADRADELDNAFRQVVDEIAARDDGEADALRASLEDALAALNDAADLLDEANARADKNARLLASAEDEINRLNDILADKDATIAELTNALTDCEDEVARLQAALADANDTIADQGDLISELERRLADALAERDAANAVIGDLEGQLADRDAIIDQFRNEIDDLQNQLADRDAQLADARLNRPLMVTSLDFGGFEGTTEPVDIAALVAERDAYLRTLQQLRATLGLVLAPLSDATALANEVPEEGSLVAVPEEINEVKILLAPFVEGELEDLQWSLRGTAGDARGRRDVGTGARIELPDDEGTYEIEVRLPGLDSTITVESDPAHPRSRDLALNVGRLALALPSGKSGLFFVTVKNQTGADVSRSTIESEGTIYLEPGLYTIETRLDGIVDTFNVQIYAGMETSAPLRL
ncbi:MAG: hypothetical protein ACPG4M_04970 [Alphaproteobacteria bacterium]